MEKRTWKLLGAAMAIALTACGEGVAVDGETAAEFDSDADELSSGVTIDGDIWFGATQVHKLGPSNTRGAYTFVVNGASEVTATLSARSPKGADTVLSLYRKTPSTWQLVTLSDDLSRADKSSALKAYPITRAGTYMLYTRVKGNPPSEVALTLECVSGACGDRCVRMLRPEAACGGVSIEQWDPHGCRLPSLCDDTCGGFRGQGCQDGFYCAFANNTCGWADQTGTCTPKPTFCTKIYKPVCGCDNQTYGNSCEAAAAGASVKKDGSCQCPLFQVPACTGGRLEYGPADANGCPTAPVCNMACGTRGTGTCTDGYWCKFPEKAACGSFDAGGTCTKPMTGVMCTALYAPVCGCDGKTYGNACNADQAQVSVASQGECPTACTSTTASIYTPAKSEVEGHWSGKASWAIEWDFKADGTFTKTDLVAPCPAGATCFWSGIVTNSGTWSVGSGTVNLSYKSPSNQAGATTPGSLSVRKDNCGVLTLVEYASSGKIAYIK